MGSHSHSVANAEDMLTQSASGFETGLSFPFRKAPWQELRLWRLSGALFAGSFSVRLASIALQVPSPLFFLHSTALLTNRIDRRSARVIIPS